MIFFLLLNTKEDILKNMGNRTVDGPNWQRYFGSRFDCLSFWHSQ